MNDSLFPKTHDCVDDNTMGCQVNVFAQLYSAPLVVCGYSPNKDKACMEELQPGGNSEPPCLGNQSLRELP